MHAQMRHISPRFPLDPAAIFGAIERSISQLDNTNYPPFNIVQLTEDDYLLEMAVAGFAEEQITISVDRNALTVEGKPAEDQGERTFLHRGIAQRAFRRTFRLGEYMVIQSADMSDGMLRISVKRELPEEARPRTIAIRKN